MSVEEVPHIEETVHSSEEEETGASLGPATVGQVGAVVPCLHNGELLLLGPDLGRPISYGQEEFIPAGVSLDRVNGSVMLAAFKTVSPVDLSVLSLVDSDDVSLLGTDEVVESVLRVILEGGSSENLLAGVSIGTRDLLINGNLVDGASGEVSVVPPEEATVGGGRDALGTALTDGDPVGIVDGVVMGLLECGTSEGLDDTLGRALS